MKTFLICIALWALSAASLAIAGGEEPIEKYLTPSHFVAPEFPSAEPVPQAGTSQRPSTPARGSQGGTEAQAPAELSPSVVWINSSPLEMRQLRGKVVLIDFWEYTCINCIRTFAENKRWYERYHKEGFEIIGVHDPEFDIAYPAENVRVAVKRFGLPYPVVVDDHFEIWKSYNNNTWPNRFLVDAKGIVRYHRDGEGGDSAFESAIRKLLQEAHPGLKFPASLAIPPERDAFAPSCGVPTEEMYVGDWSGRGILANAEGYHKGKTINYQLPAGVGDGRAAVSGAWETDANGMTYRGKRKGAAAGDDKLEMRYHARELYAVMNVSKGRPSRLYIQQDGHDLTPANKGADVQLDSDGRSYIEVREPRMYYLVANAASGSHQVTMKPTQHGLTVNSFTFGNDCQTNFPHL